MEDTSFGERLVSQVGPHEDANTAELKNQLPSTLDSKRKSDQGPSHRGSLDRSLRRSSKHAPSELTSKKAVTRQRDVILINEIPARDPRYEPFTGPLNKEKIMQKYAFLEDYENSEISELKQAIRKAKTETQRKELQGQLKVLESRHHSKLAKQKFSSANQAHRSRERALVQQGKKPYFLKRGAIKESLLREEYETMRPRQLEQKLARRRRKVASKMRSEMPDHRRKPTTTAND